MSTTTAPALESKTGLWSGGKSPLKASWGKLMMWFFLLSDAFTFSGFLVAYGMIRYRHLSFDQAQELISGGASLTTQEYWPIPEYVFKAVPFLHGVNAPLVFVGIMTFILILSSVTMVLAVEAGHRNDRKGVVKWMVWTLVGGIAFLSCQAWEWSHFIHGEGGSVMNIFNTEKGIWESIQVFGASLTVNEYGPPAFAALFFFITGFHGTHVFSGVVLNFMVFYNAAVGVYERKGSYEMVEKVGLYWHFVDLVWVFVFTFFYLI